MIKVPTLFRYTSNKAVPWNYTNQIIAQESQVIWVSLEKKQDAPVNDIVGTSEMTHSGQCYALDFSRVKEGEKHVE